MKVLRVLIKDKLYRLLHLAGVDRPVFFALSVKTWNMLAGLVTMLLVATIFSPELQGYYYTFASILAFQFLIELGLGNVILQFASHEWSKLSINENGQIVGEPEALSRLQSLARFAFHWYLIAAIILTVLLMAGGYYFFSRDLSPDINWKLPWLTLCIFNGIIFFLVPCWALLEGCNQVSSVYANRLVQSFSANLIMWIALFFGADLWIAPIASLVTSICALFFIVRNYGAFFRSLLFSRPLASVIQWRTELWPLQWRTTITWLIGALAFTLFTPILFQYHGAVIAGQMGMTLNVINVAGAISGSWLIPKVPQFGLLIAQKKYEELDILFWRTTKIVVSITLLVASAIFIAVNILNWLNHPLSTRLLSPLPFVIFLMAQILVATSAPFAYYLRAHKKEPLLFLCVASGILIALSNLILGKYYSATGMAFGYLLVNMTLIPLVVVTWHRCKIAWHSN